MLLFRRHAAELIVAITTALFIYLYPFFVYPGASEESAHSFRNAFGSVAVISYIVYLAFLALFWWLVRKFHLGSPFFYAAHVAAFLLGYSILYWAYYSISHGGMAMIV